jgi:hypothetical protein
MLGAIILAVLIVLAFPVAFLMSTAIGALLIGQAATVDAENRHEGSELIDLYK